MKKVVLLLIVLIGLKVSSYAQDYIHMKDGSIIQVAVKEINDKYVVYVNYHSQEGQEFAVEKTKIFKIVSENGYIKTFDNNFSQQPEYSTYSKNEKDNYFALAAGFGRSYGGVGLRAQARFGKQMGLGIHLGLGANPGAGTSYDVGGVCWSLGVKYFIYKGFYINFQGGFVNYEKYYWYEEENIQSYHGFSLLTGGDYFFNDHIGLNFAIGSTYAFPVNESIRPLRITFDLGIIFKF